MRRTVAVAVLLSSWLLFLGHSPAVAFPLTGCTMRVQAVDANGALYDWVTGGLVDSEVDEPFDVEWDGSVNYEATTGTQTITDYAAHLDVYGIPMLHRSDPNANGDQAATASQPVLADPPFRFTGLYFVSGEIVGSGGRCQGNGWVRVVGDPVGTVPFWFAIGSMLIGLLLLGASVRAHGAIQIAAGLVGGVAVGVALAVLLVIYAIVPFGAGTPAFLPEVMLLIGLSIGIGVIVVARSWRGPGTADVSHRSAKSRGR